MHRTKACNCSMHRWERLVREIPPSGPIVERADSKPRSLIGLFAHHFTGPSYVRTFQDCLVSLRLIVELSCAFSMIQASFWLRPFHLRFSSSCPLSSVPSLDNTIFSFEITHPSFGITIPSLIITAIDDVDATSAHEGYEQSLWSLR